MRQFNTSGPCDPTRHYTVIRPALLQAGQARVEAGQYFTIFAPRQTGKTTYFQLLLPQLAQAGYRPIWISFESYKRLTAERFYQAFSQDLQGELGQVEGDTPLITDGLDLRNFFAKQRLGSQPIVIVIDEFEGIPDEVLGEVMHTFRQIYHRREYYALHSLILVGVSTISEMVLTTASPFNIGDELEIPYFTHEEVNDLIEQYISESGQPFEREVIEAIYHNTNGQPGLTCALCQHLVTQVVTDRTQPISMSAFYQTLQFFLMERMHKNIINIVQKGRQRANFILKLLFRSDPIPFAIYDPDIAWLAANGVIDNVGGQVEISVPLYKKALITAFRPTINGESEHYLTSAHDGLSDYLTAEGRLNLNALLQAYRAYVQRRGYRAFDTETLREGAWHYSLDGFLAFFIEQLGGQTYLEVPSGRGRIDLLIRYRGWSEVIEVKVYRRVIDFKRGKGQLASYLETEGLSEGYYVVFSKLHTAEDTLYTEETVSGKRIYTHIIRTKFEPPSRLPVPEALKSNKGLAID